MLPFDELWPALDELAPRLPAATRPLADAAGAWLLADAPAAWDLPRADNSAMDGFAVRANDAAVGASLRLVGTAYAGADDLPPVGPGQAARVGTGGHIPPGADAVVPKENARVDGATVTIAQAPAPGDHIRAQGEELLRGEAACPAGTRLSPYARAALAAAGVTQVEVARPARVHILATGSELVPPGRTPTGAQVVETNGTFLHDALARLRPVELSAPAMVVDDEERLRQALGAALDAADLVVTTGGVSVGDRDLVKEIAAELGVEQRIWRVAIKPGKPLYVGRRGATLLVGLPGNPAAVGVGLPTVLLPLLDAMAGAPQIAPARWPVRLDTPVRQNSKRHQLRWARRCDVTDGVATAAPLQRSGSHMLSDLAQADVLLVIPPGDAELPAGTVVEAIELPAVG